MSNVTIDALTLKAVPVTSDQIELDDGVGGSWKATLGSLPASTAQTTAFAARAANLSDLASAATARGNLGLGTAATLAFDTDGTLSANSDARIATQKATKTYVDNAVTGILDFKGNIDASTDPNYPAALKGDAYVISVAGKIGGASGIPVDVGDFVAASADNAGGTQAGVGTSWFILEHNLQGALLAANNLSDLLSAATARTNLGLGTAATQNTTAFAQTANNLSDLASAATARGNLGVAIGTDVQGYSANLTTLAAVAPGAVGLQILAFATLTAGALIYGSATNTAERLAPGTVGQVLTMGASLPTWATPFTGVTSVTAGTGLNVGAGPGGTITTTGTLNLADTAVTPGAYTLTNLTVDQQGRITLAASGTVSLTTQVTGTLPVANGGTGQVTASASFAALSPLTTKGDLLTFSTVNDRLAVGTNGQVLTADSTQATGLIWATPTTGTVTSVVAGTGLNVGAGPGGTITSTGTLNLANTAVTPGAYTLTNLTVDAQGRLTAAASGTVSLTTQVTGILPITNGGTGATTLAGAGIVAGSGVAGRVAYWDSASTLTSDANFLFSADQLTLNTTTVASANTGTMMVGPGGFAGGGGGNFAGNAAGTLYAANSLSTFTGSLLDVQNAGSSILRVESISGATAGIKIVPGSSNSQIIAINNGVTHSSLQLISKGNGAVNIDTGGTGGIALRPNGGNALLVNASDITVVGRPFYVTAGTAAAPGLAMSTDTNTGLAWTAADNLALVTGGTTKMLIDGTAITITNNRLEIIDGSVSNGGLVFASGGGATLYKSGNGWGIGAAAAEVATITSTGMTLKGNFTLTTAGNGIYIKEGTNATSGVATLVAGTVVVNTTKVTATSRIQLTGQNLGTITVPVGLYVSARTAGTSFTILSGNLVDTSDIAWVIIEPAS